MPQGYDQVLAMSPSSTLRQLAFQGESLSRARPIAELASGGIEFFLNCADRRINLVICVSVIAPVGQLAQEAKLV